MPPKPRRAAGRGAGRGAARLRWHPAPRRPGAPHCTAQDFAPRQRSSSASYPPPPCPSDPSDRCCEPKALAEPRTVHHPGPPGASQDPTAPHGHPGPNSARTVPWAVPRSREPRALQHPVNPLSPPGPDAPQLPAHLTSPRITPGVPGAAPLSPQLLPGMALCRRRWFLYWGLPAFKPGPDFAEIASRRPRPAPLLPPVPGGADTGSGTGARGARGARGAGGRGGCAETGRHRGVTHRGGNCAVPGGSGTEERRTDTGRDTPGSDARERWVRRALPAPGTERDGGSPPIPWWSSPSRSLSRGSGYAVPPHGPSPRPRTVGAAPRCSPLRCPPPPSETETNGEVSWGAQRCSPVQGTNGPGDRGFKKASGRGRVYSVSFLFIISFVFHSFPCLKRCSQLRKVQARTGKKIHLYQSTPRSERTGSQEQAWHHAGITSRTQQQFGVSSASSCAPPPPVPVLSLPCLLYPFSTHSQTPQASTPSSSTPLE